MCSIEAQPFYDGRAATVAFSWVVTVHRRYDTSRPPAWSTVVMIEQLRDFIHRIMGSIPGSDAGVLFFRQKAREREFEKIPRKLGELWVAPKAMLDIVRPRYGYRLEGGGG